MYFVNVVNCFQIVFLYRSLTTFWSSETSTSQLWIAFKLYFYIGLWQLLRRQLAPQTSCELLSNCIFISVFDNDKATMPKPENSCELLSNCIFISVFDNLQGLLKIYSHVVNCFQIVFLYRSLTTLWGTISEA